MHATGPFITETNLDGIEVYPGAAGGWPAGVVVRSVPLGVADVIGTPTAAPLATSAAAEEMAQHLLQLCLATADANLARGPVPGTFAVLLLHGQPITPPHSLMAACGKDPERGPERLSREVAHGALERVLATHLPGEVTADAIAALPDRAAAELRFTVAEAMLAGALRHPANPVLCPSFGAGAGIVH